MPEKKFASKVKLLFFAIKPKKLFESLCVFDLNVNRICLVVDVSSFDLCVFSGIFKGRYTTLIIT